MAHEDQQALSITLQVDRWMVSFRRQKILGRAARNPQGSVREAHQMVPSFQGASPEKNFDAFELTALAPV